MGAAWRAFLSATAMFEVAVLAEAAPGQVETVRQLLLDPLTEEQIDQLHEISTRILEAARPGSTEARQASDTL